MITLASGSKMGKTEKGAIWLNEDYFLHMNIGNFGETLMIETLKDFLNYFTEIETTEIEEICKKEKNINNLKILLANEATKILHGIKSSQNAERTAKETFEGSGLGMDLPEIKLNKEELSKGIDLLNFLAESKIMSSKSEARRAIANNGLKLNNKLIKDEKKILNLDDFTNKILKISHGKKKHFIIKII